MFSLSLNWPKVKNLKILYDVPNHNSIQDIWLSGESNSINYEGERVDLSSPLGDGRWEHHVLPCLMVMETDLVEREWKIGQKWDNCDENDWELYNLANKIRQ